MNTEAPQKPGYNWLDRRLERIASMLEVGVELRSALTVELIRSLYAPQPDPAAIDRLFEHAAEADREAAELTTARQAAQRDRYPEAIADLQAYLHRTLVDEVPVAERRLRRSPRFARSG